MSPDHRSGIATANSIRLRCRSKTYRIPHVAAHATVFWKLSLEWLLRDTPNPHQSFMQVSSWQGVNALQCILLDVRDKIMLCILFILEWQPRNGNVTIHLRGVWTLLIVHCWWDPNEAYDTDCTDPGTGSHPFCKSQLKALQYRHNSLTYQMLKTGFSVEAQVSRESRQIRPASCDWPARAVETSSPVSGPRFSGARTFKAILFCSELNKLTPNLLLLITHECIRRFRWC